MFLEPESGCVLNRREDRKRRCACLPGERGVLEWTSLPVVTEWRWTSETLSQNRLRSRLDRIRELNWWRPA